MINLSSRTKIIFLFLLFLKPLYARKIIKKNESWNTFAHHWFDMKSLQTILKHNSSIGYIPCFDKVPFNYKKFPFSYDLSLQPNEGYLLPTFILTIPQGIVQGIDGIVLIDKHFIKEMQWKFFNYYYLNVPQVSHKNIKKYSGKVAVITQPAYNNYFHWITEILGRLALLEIFKVQYDYLYVPQISNYMKETLQLWGIDEEKIIAPTSDKDFIIQADELVLPSIIINTNHGFTQLVNYIHPYTFEYVRKKLLNAVALQDEIDYRIKSDNEQKFNFSKRIFISRQDAKIRRVLNEDEAFEPFKQYGFERYELSKLSVADQIRLFRQAEIIVSPQGTGLANIMFCNPDVKVIELFQGLCDSAIFNMAQILHLNYIPIQTIPFEKDFLKAWLGHTNMPSSIINKVIKYF